MITHAVIFAPIGQASRSEQIVRRLSNAIITGLLAAHEQLPNEADLAKMMGVSHITIREALNTLRANQLIYTVRGRHGGSFVCEINVAAKSQRHPLRALSMDYLSDLGEMHGAIISHCARLASQRMLLPDVLRMQEFIEILKKADAPEQKMQADMRCLLTLAANSHSARLAAQALQLQAEWAPLVAVLYRDQPVTQQIVCHYESLIGALARHDEVESVQVSLRLIDTCTSALIESKLHFSADD